MLGEGANCGVERVGGGQVQRPYQIQLDMIHVSMILMGNFWYNKMTEVAMYELCYLPASVSQQCHAPWCVIMPTLSGYFVWCIHRIPIWQMGMNAVSFLSSKIH